MKKPFLLLTLLPITLSAWLLSIPCMLYAQNNHQQVNNSFAEKYTFRMSRDSIEKINYDSNTTVIELVAREILGHKTHQPLYHFQHTDFNALYSNIIYIDVDSLLRVFPGDSLKTLVSGSFRPLFTEKGDIKLKLWNESHISFEYRVLYCNLFHEEAIVIVNEENVYSFRRNPMRLWKLYNYSSIMKE